MKKIILKIVFITAIISCKAQSIIPLDSDQDLFVQNSNNYYKDVAEDFDKFVGTWKYVNGNTSFTIILKKEEHVATLGFFEDLLTGEYKYIENNQILINTLDLMNDPFINGYKHHITSQYLMKNRYYPKCNDCILNEKRIKLSIENDNTINLISGFIVLRYINDGQEKIELYLKITSSVIFDENAPQNFEVPSGYYMLIKQ